MALSNRLYNICFFLLQKHEFKEFFRRVKTRWALLYISLGLVKIFHTLCLYNILYHYEMDGDNDDDDDDDGDAAMVNSWCVVCVCVYFCSLNFYAYASLCIISLALLSFL